MLVIVITVLVQGFRVPADLRGEIKGNLFVNSGFFQAVGVISFGKLALPYFVSPLTSISICLSYVQVTARIYLLCCLISRVDHNSLLIYGSLKKPTMDRFATVTHYSTAISMVMCLIMAIAGFLSFGSKTQGNVLNNFPSDNIMVNIARL